MNVEDIVDEARPFSDQPERATLAGMAETFVAAHRRAPGGISIEIGTRCGGSALMFLRLLERLYPSDLHRPLLVTVDPYGDKPYDGGTPLYGDEHYVAMRKLLARFPNHQHYTLTSVDFFSRMPGARFWRGRRTAHATILAAPGQPIGTAPVNVGIEQRFAQNNTAFVLLDGQHDWFTILEELNALYLATSWMHRRGVVVVDNVDSDIATIPGLKDLHRVMAVNTDLRGTWAVLTTN